MDVYGPVSDPVVDIASFEVIGVAAGVKFYDRSPLFDGHQLNLTIVRRSEMLKCPGHLIRVTVLRDTWKVGDLNCVIDLN